jgi:hypothetical protein
MSGFYQSEYFEPGLTTDLPSDSELQQLLGKGFRGSPKDFSGGIALLRDLGLNANARLLDYGANWGYTTWQLRRAGFMAEAFEISQPRAKFAQKLGIQVTTRVADLRPPFDAIYSGHVLEHTSNPLATIRQQLDWLGDGGMVIAHTPNGSAARRAADGKGFHSNWGQVHPFLLTGDFITNNFARLPFFVSTSGDLGAIRAWDKHSSNVGDLSGSVLLIIIRKTLHGP